MRQVGSLNHTRWECKYHIVFMPKYRRKVIFGQIRRGLGDLFHCPSCKYNRAASVVIFCVFHRAAILPYRWCRPPIWEMQQLKCTM